MNSKHYHDSELRKDLTENEYIVAVAIRVENLIVTMPKPARHGDILKPLHALNSVIVAPSDQGFLTSQGRFVDRLEAVDIAVNSKQIAKPKCVNWIFILK